MSGIRESESIRELCPRCSLAVARAGPAGTRSRVCPGLLHLPWAPAGSPHQGLEPLSRPLKPPRVPCEDVAVTGCTLPVLWTSGCLPRWMWSQSGGVLKFPGRNWPSLPSHAALSLFLGTAGRACSVPWPLSGWGCLSPGLRHAALPTGQRPAFALCPAVFLLCPLPLGWTGSSGPTSSLPKRSAHTTLPSRLAQSRTNPQVLDTGLSVQDMRYAQSLSPVDWDKPDSSGPEQEDVFSF